MCKDENNEISDEAFNESSLVDIHSSSLNKRLADMRVSILAHTLKLPPNPSLSPVEFIMAVLEELRHPDSLMSQSGYRTLLRSSSERWKLALKNSIGVPSHLEMNKNKPMNSSTCMDGLVTEDALVSSLAAAMTRPKNQYQILVQDFLEDEQEEENTSKHKIEPGYSLSVSEDIIDYNDGKCWVEAQLRHPTNGQLYAILGWSLKRNNEGAWVIDWLDWQDFRDEFRPGHGREEWMRICG